MSKSNKQRALGTLLYHAGSGYWKAGMFADAGDEAVQELYQIS